MFNDDAGLSRDVELLQDINILLTFKYMLIYHLIGGTFIKYVKHI